MRDVEEMPLPDALATLIGWGWTAEAARADLEATIKSGWLLVYDTPPDKRDLLGGFVGGDKRDRVDIDRSAVAGAEGGDWITVAVTVAGLERLRGQKERRDALIAAEYTEPTWEYFGPWWTPLTVVRHVLWHGKLPPDWRDRSGAGENETPADVLIREPLTQGAGGPGENIRNAMHHARNAVAFLLGADRVPAVGFRRQGDVPASEETPIRASYWAHGWIDRRAEEWDEARSEISAEVWAHVRIPAGDVVRLYPPPWMGKAPPPEDSPATMPAPRPGMKTTTGQQAEEACGEWLRTLTEWRPKPDVQAEAQQRWPKLSRNAFGRAWKANTPDEWQARGRRPASGGNTENGNGEGC